MADSYPTLGLHIDLNEVDQAAARLTAVRQTFKDIGAEAAKSGQQATTAVTQQASAFRAAMNQMQADAARVLTFRMNLLHQEQVEIQANAAAESAALKAIGQQRMAAYAQWSAASKTANAQMLSDTLSRITDANAEEYLAAAYAIEQQQRAVAAKRESEAAQASLTAARVADEIASEDLIAVYRTEAQIKRVNDARAAAAYEAEAAAEAAAAQAVAAEAAQAARETALAQDRASYENWWRMKAAMIAEQEAEQVAAAEATAAAAVAANERIAASMNAMHAENLDVMTGGNVAEFMAAQAAIDNQARAYKELMAVQAEEQALRDADAAATARQAAAGDAYVAQLEEQVRTLGMTRAQLAAYKAEQLGVSAETAASVQALEAYEKSAGGAGLASVSMAGSVRELLVIIRELARGDFTRLGGSISLEIQRLGLLGKAITFVTNPFTIAAAATLVFGKAMADGAAETDRLNNLMKATGDYAGVTSGQFYTMAQTIAEATNTGIGKAEKTLMALVASGQLAGFQLQSVGLAATELAALTGEKADKVAESLAKMVEDPTKGAMKLEEQYHALSAAQYEHIAALEREGDKQGAFNALMGDFNATLATQAQQLGPLGGLIHGIAGFWDGAWNAAKRYGDYVMNGLPMGQQVLQIQSQINDLQAHGAPLHDPVRLGFGQDDLATLFAKRDALIKQGQADNQKAENAQVQTRGAEGASALDTAIEHIKTSADVAKDKIAALHKEYDAFKAAYDRAPTADGKAELARFTAAMPALEADARKGITRAENRVQRQSNTEQRGMLDDQAKITSLGAQLGNLDPTAVTDAMAKIQEAYDKAYASWSKSNNAFEQANAGRHAADAADIERLTVWNQLANANDKQTRSEKDKQHALELTGAATTAANAILQAYYQTNVTNLDAYAAALQAQDQIVLKAQDDQANYAIALQYGATSVDGIAAALIASLPPWVEVTDAVLKDAQASQNHAQKTLEATKATNAQALANKNLTDATRQTTASLANTSAIDQYVIALRKGIAAVADYNRSQAIAKALPGAGNNLGVATANVDRDAVANSAKITAQLAEQARLSGLSSVDREAEARAAQLIAGYIAKTGQSYESLDQATKDRLATEAKITVQNEQQRDALDKMSGSIQDSMRSNFINTGNLDFSAFGDGIEKELRRAIYDTFLAEPIKVALDIDKNFLKQIEDALNSATGGAAGNALKFLGQTYADAQAGSSMASMLGFKGNDNKQAQQAANMIASGIGEAIAGPIGGQIGSALAQIVGGFLGPKPSNFTATGSFSGYGYTVGGDKPNDNTTSAASGIAGGIAADIAALSRLGIDATGIISSFAIGQRDPSRLTLTNGATEQTATGDAAALQKAAEQALLSMAKYKDPSENALVSQMQSANRNFSDITAALGVAADALRQLHEDGITGGLTQAELTFLQSGASGGAADIVGARTSLSDLQTANLQYTDPQAYALAQLQQSQTKRRADIQAYADEGLLTPDQMAAINATLSALESNETTNVLSQFNSAIMTAAQKTQALAAAQQQLITFLKGLDNSSLSPLSPTDQLKAAQNAYQTDLTMAQGGDPAAMQALAADAQTYLTSAQGYYGSSTSYADIYNSVKSNLTSLSTGKFATAAGASAATASSASGATTATVDTSQMGQITASLGQVVTAVQDVGSVITDQMGAQYAALQAMQSGQSYQQVLLNGGLAG